MTFHGTDALLMDSAFFGFTLSPSHVKMYPKKSTSSGRMSTSFCATLVHSPLCASACLAVARGGPQVSLILMTPTSPDRDSQMVS